MGAGEAKAYGGFNLAAFAPRKGKKATCSSSCLLRPGNNKK